MPDGSRSTGRSTGETSKVRAENLVRELWKAGKLLPEKTPTLATYTEKWFLWDECPSLKSKLKAGGTHTRGHADNQRRWLTKYIWPNLGDKRIDAITPKDCELWLDWLVKEKKAAVNSVRNYGKTLSLIFSEAARIRDVPDNPMKAIRLPVRPKTEKGIPSEEETAKLLNRDAWPEDKKFGNLYHLFNLVAHGTGMRLAEIQVIRLQDIHDDHIHVKHSWHEKYGLGPTKGKKERYVPISKGAS